MNDIDRVKEAARGRWHELLQDIGGIHGEFLDGRHRPCPKCGGTDRFRMLDADAGAVICNQCFAEKNGDGLAAIRWMTGKTFRDVLELVADRVGVQLEDRRSGGTDRGRPPKDGGLQFLDWSSSVVSLWTLRKPGISADAVKANGGRLAHWVGSDRNRHHVIALPIVGSTGRPRGWTIYNSSGGLLPKAGGDPVKVLCTRGAKTGWLGSDGASRIQDAAVVWKTEGPSDMLALWTAIPEDARGAHAVVANPFGAGERPKPVHLDGMTGKTVVIVSDRDDAGRAGAQRWGEALAAVGANALVLEVPGPGKDLRDWLLAGGTFEELKALARAVEPTASPEAKLEGEGVDWDEHENDPARLGRLFVRERAGRFRHWRGDAYRWAGGHWQAISRVDLDAEIVECVRREFRRICTEKRASAATDDEPPKCHKITRTLISDVRICATVDALVPSHTEWGSELQTDDEEGLQRATGGIPRQWIAFRNGILDVGSVLAGERVELCDLAPSWWSPHVLPYDYQVGATPGRYWNRFLEENLRGDEERISLLQEWMGYCLLPWTDLQRCLLLEGEGANGKSVYCSVLEAVLGRANCSHVGIELFGQRFSLVPTIGKLANLATEVGELDKVAEGTFKAFVAGEEITIDRKGRDAISVTPTARLTIATNNRPRFSDRSDGIWRRILLVGLEHVVQPERRILGMDKPEWWISGPGAAELPGVFNWALDGLARLKLHGDFTDASCVREAVSEYRTDTNPAREFLVDTYEEVEEDVSILAPEVYSAYRKWCDESGYKALGARMFGREVRRAFPRAQRVRSSAVGRPWEYRGLRSRSQVEWSPPWN